MDDAGDSRKAPCDYYASITYQQTRYYSTYSAIKTDIPAVQPAIPRQTFNYMVCGVAEVPVPAFWQRPQSPG